MVASYAAGQRLASIDALHASFLVVHAMWYPSGVFDHSELCSCHPEAHAVNASIWPTVMATSGQNGASLRPGPRPGMKLPGQAGKP